MKVLTQNEIEKLITCPKEIIVPPKKEMVLERGSRRNNMELISKEQDLKFKAFMRINNDFPENFSIGLVYWPKGERESICLVRCNGPHGDFLSSTMSQEHSHFYYHIHKAKQENIEQGMRAERNADVTREYASYEQAIQYFLRIVNVINADKFFILKSRQINMDFESEELKP